MINLFVPFSTGNRATIPHTLSSIVTHKCIFRGITGEQLEDRVDSITCAYTENVARGFVP